MHYAFICRILSLVFIGSSIYYLDIVIPAHIIVSPLFITYHGIQIMRRSAQTPVQTDTPRSRNWVPISSIKSQITDSFY